MNLKTAALASLENIAREEERQPGDDISEQLWAEVRPHVFVFSWRVRYLYNMMVHADISRKCNNSQLPFVFVLIKT